MRGSACRAAWRRTIRGRARPRRSGQIDARERRRVPVRRRDAARSMRTTRRPVLRRTGAPRIRVDAHGAALSSYVARRRIRADRKANTHGASGRPFRRSAGQRQRVEKLGVGLKSPGRDAAAVRDKKSAMDDILGRSLRRETGEGLVVFDSTIDRSQPKPALYKDVAVSLAALLEGETDALANVANAVALLSGALDRINWCGFYVLRERRARARPLPGQARLRADRARQGRLRPPPRAARRSSSPT